jgi:hypothetical protein
MVAPMKLAVQAPEETAGRTVVLPAVGKAAGVVLSLVGLALAVGAFAGVVMAAAWRTFQALT